MVKEIIYKELSYIINGVLFKVHNQLGRYCNEKQYADCVEQKLKEKNIEYEKEKVIPESFKGERPRRNRVDFIINNCIIIELKCTRFTTREHYYQIQRYLNAYNIKLGILVNFRDKYLKPKRILNSKFKK